MSARGAAPEVSRTSGHGYIDSGDEARLSQGESMAVPSLKDLAAGINREHAAALEHAESAMEHARLAGALLLQAKDALGHGEWLPWLAAHTQVSVRKAQRYMRLAQANTTRVSHLSQRAALAELSTPVDEPTPKPKAAPAEDDEVHSKRADCDDPREPVRVVIARLRARHQKELDAELGKLREQFFDAVYAEATKQVGEREERVLEREREVSLKERAQAGALRDISKVLTCYQFKFILGCLHPDQPTRDPAKLNTAFSLFNSLEKTVDLSVSVAELRRRGGWEAFRKPPRKRA